MQKSLLLWIQLKNCLKLMEKTNERKVKPEEFTKKRIILKQQTDNLKEIRKRTKLEPVMSEQEKPVFENIEQLCQAVNGLGFAFLDPSKCQVEIPSVIVNQKATMTITLKNKNNNPVTNNSEEINVLIENTRDHKAIEVRAINELGSGRYEASFTANRCGYYMISITVDGHHISDSPYK